MFIPGGKINDFGPISMIYLIENLKRNTLSFVGKQEMYKHLLTVEELIESKCESFYQPRGKKSCEFSQVFPPLWLPFFVQFSKSLLQMQQFQLCNFILKNGKKTATSNYVSRRLYVPRFAYEFRQLWLGFKGSFIFLLARLESA